MFALPQLKYWNYVTDQPLVSRNLSVEPQRQSTLRRSLNHPLAHLALALLIVGLLQGFVVKIFVVPSASMEQSLAIGDRIIVNRLAYSLGDQPPAPGDVVVFHTEDNLWPTGQKPLPNTLLDSIKFGAKRVFGDYLGIGPTTQRFLVKRVIGIAGQTIECCSASGSLLSDGQAIDEKHIFRDLPFSPGTNDCQTQPRSHRCFPPVTVPEGELLLLGDHRSKSSDGISHCRGSMDLNSAACVRWAKTDDVLGKVQGIIFPLDRFGVLQDGLG